MSLKRKFVEFAEQFEDGLFFWCFSSRTSPDDETPLMPSYDSFDKRLSSFCDLTFKFPSKRKWLAELGFYFSPNSTDGEVACFCCGATTSLTENEFFNFVTNFVFPHHFHCPFMNELLKEGHEWLESSKDPENEDDEDLTYDKEKEQQLLEKVRKEILAERALHEETTKEINKDENKRNLWFCNICDSRSIETTFLPCKHRTTCIPCAKELTECSSCKKPISGIGRFYASNLDHNVESSFN